MDDYVKVVGRNIPDDEWEASESSMEDLEDLGLSVIKVLSFVGGAVKYVCLFNGGYPGEKDVKKIEKLGWKICQPYYSNGKISGFKVYRNQIVGGSNDQRG